MRHEFKYLLPNYRVDELRDALRRHLVLDAHAARNAAGRYTVRSIYFDSVDLVCYYEKLSGIKDRKKLRIRGYDTGSDGVVFLEIKRKTNMLISKNRAEVAFEDLPAIFTRGNADGYFSPGIPAADDARRFFFHLHRHAMRPIECVNYEREPFVCPYGTSLRVTLDRDLRSISFPSIDRLYDETDVVPALPDHTILEIKLDVERGLPRWVRPLLTRYNLKKQALSKYTICLDTHDIVGRGRRRVMRQAAWAQPPDDAAGTAPGPFEALVEMEAAHAE